MSDVASALNEATAFVDQAASVAPREGNTFVEAVTPIFYAIVEDLTERELAVLRYLPSRSSPIDVPRLRQCRRTQHQKRCG